MAKKKKDNADRRLHREERGVKKAEALEAERETQTEEEVNEAMRRNRELNDLGGAGRVRGN